MSKLLYLQCSPRGKRSKSSAVADAFVEAYKQTNPDDTVEKLNVFEMDLPSFDGFTVQAKYSIMHGQRHSDEEAQAWKAVEAIIEQFKSADKYVLSTPMWNYSIPYRLKQYIDIIVQPGYTLYVDKQDQVANKPFLAIYARGGEHAGEPDDLQTKYIEVIFGAIGFTDIKSIIVEPTLQDGPDVTEKKVKAAIGSARKIAENF